MQYFLSKRFEKDFSKLQKKVKVQAIEALDAFAHNPHNRSLRSHSLSGRWKGYYSIDVTGDIRAVYTYVLPDLARFAAIGTHSQLYRK